MNQPRPSFWTIANVFTFTRFVCGPLCAACFLMGGYWGLWVGGWLGGLAMFTDVCDGYFARRQKQVSDIGKIFDPIADAVFFVLVWTALGLEGAFPVWLALPFLAREFVQHVYLRPTAARHGLVLAANFWGKTKTLVQTLVFIAMCWFEFFCEYWPSIAVWVKPANLVMISVTALVSVLSILPYFKTLRAVSRQPAAA
ncbi:MAG: CDP-alcohol phosphatidyltransferase family protein [Planctomycetes bacterium]|nr:CDP-alcohol phosphatidyltransferase family protein [Planctomycetota bacterium]